MIASIKFNSLVSEININKDNIKDFIDYIKIISNKPIIKEKPMMNDPNPIMCYIGDQRVIPGTEVPFNVNTYNLNDFQNNNPESAIIEYDLEGKRFINCTPHDVVFHYKKNGEVIVMKPSSTLIRVYTEFERSTNDDHIYNKQKKVTIDLPEPTEGIIYIVSQVVFSMLPERKDLVFPNSLHAVRDDNNKVIGVHSFVER